jgi:hypothetical protein
MRGKKFTLPGLNWSPSRDGKSEYAYRGRGRGAIKLEGGRDSPEQIELLIASYHRAKAERPKADPKTFKSIVAEYMASPAFTHRRERTRADYLKHIRKIEDAFGDLPIAALNDPRVTKDFLDWRDGMADSPRQADYAWTVLCESYLGHGAECTPPIGRQSASNVFTTATAAT